MIEPKEISKAANWHLAKCIAIVGLLTAASVAVGLQGNTTICYAAISAFTFALVECLALILTWKWVVVSHFNYITTFHTAASGARMLLALAALCVVFAFVGRDAMAPYVIVFGAYYFVLLVLHSVFFAKQTKILFDNKQ